MQLSPTCRQYSIDAAFCPSTFVVPARILIRTNKQWWILTSSSIMSINGLWPVLLAFCTSDRLHASMGHHWISFSHASSGQLWRRSKSPYLIQCVFQAAPQGTPQHALGPAVDQICIAHSIPCAPSFSQKWSSPSSPLFRGPEACMQFPLLRHAIVSSSALRLRYVDCWQPSFCQRHLHLLGKLCIYRRSNVV